MIQTICTIILVIQFLGLVGVRLFLKDDWDRVAFGWLLLTLWPILVPISFVALLWERSGLFVHVRKLVDYTERDYPPSEFERTRIRGVWKGSWERSDWYSIELPRGRCLTLGRAREGYRG